jgi:aromatic ring-opening dioxygenase catalytic subunit (LigB family)
MTHPRQTLLTRREALLALGAAALSACQPTPKEAPMPAPAPVTPPPAPAPMPAVFLPHGGGPWPFTLKGNEVGPPGTWDRMDTYMRQTLRMTPPARPAAILTISAHWEAPTPTLMTSPRPPMLYDYYGFPPETYEVQWPAPGAPALADRVRELLEGASLGCALDDKRGFDHGVFVPLKLAWPQADVPTSQLSLKAGLDPLEHLKIGQALAPLRREGVFLVGSGMSYHNLRALMGAMRGGDSGQVTRDSRAFDEWLADTMALEPSQRYTRLIEWAKAPAARAAHPREEHLLPLMVIAGAALEDAATLPYRDKVLHAHVSAVHFA